MGDADGWKGATGNKEEKFVQIRRIAWPLFLRQHHKEQQTAPRSLGPLVIKILCAAAQLGLGSSGDFNGTKKH